MTVQIFFAINWQEKKLLIVTIFTFLVNDYLNCVNIRKCMGRNKFDEPLKVKKVY